MFRLLIRLILLAVVVVPGSLGLGIYLALDRRPSVDHAAEFTPDHIERAKRILDSNDPRRLRTGVLRTVAVTAGDADLALNYLAHRYADGSAEAQFESGRLHLRGSLRTSVLPSSPYLNLDVQLVEGSPLPAIERFRVGRLPVPASLAQVAFGRLLQSVWSEEDLAVLRDAVREVQFAESGARLTYRWHRDLADTFRAALIRPEHRDRLRVYQAALADATRVLPPGRVSLVDLITPLFAVAVERSRTSDPITENRAAILVLTLYVDGRSVADLIPDAQSWPRARPRAVTLNQRGDFTLHFMISAALSANTGGPFADAVGLYKEVADSRGGSGFSFNDIAADRAGSRLGELAEGKDSARRLQLRLGVPLTERVVMPETSDLPEFLSESEFERRFGSVGAPAYARMMADIESRIAALALFAD